MMIYSEEVKKISFRLGADLCGIASVERFEEAPRGFHPRDVLQECESVIVLATRFLTSTLLSKSTIPYTNLRNDLSRKMDVMAMNLSYELESRGDHAVPVTALGPTEWDESTEKARGIISLKHAGELAGLGKIGKNTLLINDKYGNMIWLSAVITSAKLEPDPIAGYEGCDPGCEICLKACPISALDGISMNQRACLEYAFGEHNGGEWRIKCFTCRKVCPNALGIRNPGLRDSNRSDLNENR
ncbi:MAG: epoxyqueuosine reductase [Candidatus Odinarchaeota archaeon]